MSKIDAAAAAALYRDGADTGTLAGMFNCTRPSIVRALHRYGQPLRVKRQASRLARNAILAKPATTDDLRRMAEKIDGTWFAPEPVKTDRDPCFFCGTRGDLGCRHREAL